VDPGFEHEALGVYQQMSLLRPFDLLGPVVAALFSSHTGALYRLGIHHASAGLRISLQANPQPLAQGGVDPLEGSVLTPSPQVMVDRLPGREVVGKQAPLSPALKHVEDGVEDLAQGVQPGASRGFGGGHMGLYVRPLGIG